MVFSVFLAILAHIAFAKLISWTPFQNQHTLFFSDEIVPFPDANDSFFAR